MFIIDWVVANWAGIVGAFTAGYAFAVAVAKLTPTKADDELLASLYGKFGAILAILPLPAASTVAKAAVAADKAHEAAAEAAAKAEAKSAALAELVASKAD